MVSIEITDNQLRRLEEDSKHFEKTIGGTWTIQNTLSEWIKILDSYSKR